MYEEKDFSTKKPVFHLFKIMSVIEGIVMNVLPHFYQQIKLKINELIIVLPYNLHRQFK